MLEKYKKILKFENNIRISFRELIEPYIDENNNIDFKKIEENGQLDDYQFILREISVCSLELKIFEMFLKEKGNIKDLDNVDANIPRLEAMIESVKRFEGVTFADELIPATRDEKGNIKPIQYFISFGKNMYDVTGKNIEEQIEIYRNALNSELEKTIGENLTEEEKQMAIQKLCTEIYKTRYDILSSNDLSR